MRGIGVRGVASLVALLTMAGLAVATPAGAAPAAAHPSRPNILLIVSDDQAWSDFNRQLNPTVFGKIVDQGVLFKRAYVNTSLCCPSRSEIMTGLYEHHTGVDANETPLSRPTLPQALHDAGYRTMLAGKYLNSWPSCDPRPEFDNWWCVQSSEPSSLSLQNPEINVNGGWGRFGGLQPDLLASAAANFIRDTPKDQPFFVMYTPTDPHLPADDPTYEDMAVQPPRPKSFDANTLTDGTPLYARRRPLLKDEIATSDQHYTDMARSVRGLDDAVGTMLDSLGDRAANTLVVYLSDNGYLFGQHRRFGKNDAWEESVRVPMAMRFPALLPATRSYATDAIVENVDVAATIADVAGLPWGADGRSLVPLLSRTRRSVRRAALLERCRAGSRWSDVCRGSFDGDTTWPPGFQGVVTSEYKYVEFDDGSRLLVNLRRDPHELVNLIGNRRYRGVVGRLRVELRHLLGPNVQTTIATGPTGASSTRVPAFTFFSPSRFSTYVCRLMRDGTPGRWTPCGPGPAVLGPLPDGRYVFEVSGIDERGRRDRTPASRSFSITSTGPPVEITAHPPSAQTSTSASFSFTIASAESVCRLFTVGDTNAPWTSCDDGVASYDGLSEGDWVFEAASQDATHHLTSPPAAWPFSVDATGPAFDFADRPAPATRSEDASFRFAPDELTRGRWTCSLDGRAPVGCSSGRFVGHHLGAGGHSLAVTAADVVGNVATATYAWSVDRTPPAFQLGGAKPAPYSGDANVQFDLVSPVADGTTLFLCRIDRGVKMPCASAARLYKVRDGVHTFTAWAVDAAGNVSAPDSYRWTIDTRPPVVKVTPLPKSGASASSSQVSFSIETNERADLFCALDGGAFTACAHEVTYVGLSSGPHTFSVYGVDRAGNQSTPVERTWTVD